MKKSFAILIRFRAGDPDKGATFDELNITSKDGVRGVEQRRGFWDKVVRTEETPETNHEASPDGTMELGTEIEAFSKSEKYRGGERQFRRRSNFSFSADFSE